MTTVVAALVEREGRVLICQRKPSQPHPLKWEFPGGKVEPGESPEGALARELEEELGISAEIDYEVERYQFSYPGNSPILLIFYAVRVFSGEPCNRIFQQITWASYNDLSKLDFLEGDVDFVRRLAAG